MKKFFLFIIICLLLASIYQDITRPLSPNDTYNNMSQEVSEHQFSIVHVKTEPDDTILSVSKRVNKNHLQQITKNQMITDFQKLNPTVNPYQLKPNTFYYFPLYNF